MLREGFRESAGFSIRQILTVSIIYRIHNTSNKTGVEMNTKDDTWALYLYPGRKKYNV